MNKRAFTMIELIFVIIILGILATVAIPKFAGVSEQAIISNGHSDVMAIRTALSTDRQKRLMQGTSTYSTHLDALTSATSAQGDKLFDGNGTSKILSYPIIAKSGSGGWMKAADNNYTYNVSDTLVTLIYNSSTGTFDCNTTAGSSTQQDFCKKLTQ